MLICRDTKHSSLMMCHNGSVALISYANLFVWPCQILFALAYIKLVNRCGHRKILYTTIAILLGYIWFFSCFQEYLSKIQASHSTINNIIDELRGSAGQFMTLLHQWPTLLYYIACELFQSVVMSVMIWQLINLHHSLREVRYTYQIYLIGGIIGTCLYSPCLTIFGYNKNLHYAIAIFSIVLLMLYMWFDSGIDKQGAPKDPQCTKGFAASMKDIFTNKQVLSIGALVLVCKIVLQYCEIITKNIMRSCDDNIADGCNLQSISFSVSVQVLILLVVFCVALVDILAAERGRRLKYTACFFGIVVCNFVGLLVATKVFGGSLGNIGTYFLILSPTSWKRYTNTSGDIQNGVMQEENKEAAQSNILGAKVIRLFRKQGLISCFVAAFILGFVCCICKDVIDYVGALFCNNSSFPRKMFSRLSYTISLLTFISIIICFAVARMNHKWNSFVRIINPACGCDIFYCSCLLRA